MARRNVWPFLLPCLSNTRRTARQGRSSRSFSEHRSLEIALRQHRHDAVGEIDRVAADLRLAVEPGAGPHVVGDVGDRHVHDAAAAVAGVGVRGGVDGIVVVARIDGIDGEEIERAQVGAAGELRRLELPQLGQHGGRELVGDAVRVHGDQADLALVLRVAERLGDARLRHPVGGSCG